MTNNTWWVVVASLAMAAAGCGDDEVSGGTPPPRCYQATSWAAGTRAFVERTSAMQLVGVEGVRLSAVDFDGDGWTDLVVRRGADEADDFSVPPACCASADCAPDVTCTLRYTWLLRNIAGDHFEDVTQPSGIVATRAGGDKNLGRPGTVFAFADIDNDGDLDAYVGSSHSPSALKSETSEVLINQGDGTFVLGPADSLVRVADKDSPAGAAFVDYDRNGVVDLWVTQNSYDGSQKQDHLYWGEGNGQFQDATAALGMTTKPWVAIADINAAAAHSISWSALACDLNDDGDAELLSSSYGRSPNHLWQATGAAGHYVFRNRSIASGYAFDERQDWSDNESARCWCKLHPQAVDCPGVPAPMYIKCEKDTDAFRWNHDYDREPFRLGGNSGPSMCGDIDNDGDMDLLTTEIVHWDVGRSSDPSELLINSGEQDVRFTRPGNETTGLVRTHDTLAWNDGDISGALFDFDNDGRLDVYIGSTDYPGTRGLLYHQLATGRFEPVPLADGIDHTRSHGVAIADFDRDGDLDVVVGHSRARCGGSTDCYATAQVRFFQNQLAQTGNWLQLKLVGGAGSNRAAIGARVKVTTDDGVTRTQQVDGGHGHYGTQHDLVLHFGLGGACSARVSVRWPNAQLSEDSFDVAAGRRYRLTQGAKQATVVERDGVDD